MIPGDRSCLLVAHTTKCGHAIKLYPIPPSLLHVAKAM
jgi:hypothetical protein